MTGVDFVSAATAPTDHAGLRAWVEDWAVLLEPERVHWCDGSDEEHELLCAELVAAGTFTRLDDELRPELVSGALRSGRRRARRGPDLHLQRSRARMPGRPTTGATRT